MEMSSPPPSWSLGDETVRLAMPPSTPTAPLPINRSSSTGEMELARGGSPSSSSTSKVWAWASAVRKAVFSFYSMLVMVVWYLRYSLVWEIICERLYTSSLLGTYVHQKSLYLIL